MLKTNISAGTNRELNYKHFFLSSNSFIEGFPSITKKKNPSTSIYLIVNGKSSRINVRPE